MENCCIYIEKSAPLVGHHSVLSDGVQFGHVVCIVFYADLAFAFAVIDHIPQEPLLRIPLGLTALLASKKDVVMKVSGKEFSLQTTTPSAAP